MKIKWSKPFEKKFYSAEKISSIDKFNQNFLVKVKFDSRNDVNNFKNISGLSITESFPNKRLSMDKQDKPNQGQHFININEYIFYFNNSEVFIFELVENHYKEDKKEIKSSNDSLSYSIDPFNEKEDFPLSDIVLHEIKKINFLAYDENIMYCTLNKDNHYILLSTDFGIVYLINISLMDFFIEVVFSFNIKQNYLYSYEILYFCESNNILLSLDNNLYICEIYKKKKNQPTQVFKNCLFKCEYMDEKILHAEKLDNLVSVFTNKAIYLVDFYDMSNTVFYKKDKINNFSGQMKDGNIYFIKDENTYAVYSITDKDKKLSFKLSSKNQLNVLNFNRIRHVDKEILIISNEKNTEIYIISMISYKIINRESILFENPNVLVYIKNKDSKAINNEKMVVVYTLNENKDVKFKIGCIKDNNLDSGIKISDSFSNSEIQKREKQNGNQIDDNHYLNNSNSLAFIHQESLGFNLISGIKENFKYSKEIKEKDEDNEFYQLKEFESDYIEENNLQDTISNQVKQIKSYISYILKITRPKKYFETFKIRILSEVFEKAILQIRLLINLFFYTSTYLNNFKNLILVEYILRIENKIKLNWIENFGSYSLRISIKISNEFQQMLIIKKLMEILGLCIKINDSKTYHLLAIKYKSLLGFIIRDNMINLIS